MEDINDEKIINFNEQQKVRGLQISIFAISIIKIGNRLLKLLVKAF